MKLIFILFISTFLLSATSIDGKIQHKKNQISSKRVEYKKMDKKLLQVANKIVTAKKERKVLSQKIKKLADRINTNEKTFVQIKAKESELSSKLEKINQKIEEKEKKFVDLVSKKFSMSLALEELNQPTSESVMMKEMYEAYAKKNSEEIKLLESEISLLNGKKEKYSSEKLRVKKIINQYVAERKELTDKKRKKDKLVKDLARDKAIYRKRFNRIIQSRKSLEKKLASLKIIKYNREEAKRAEQREREIAQRILAEEKEEKIETVNDRVIAQKSPEDIARVKPSVIAIPTKVVKYRGGKTISPLSGAVLIKKFGSYIDPIYKFKIFNKSITLKAPHSGSKVKCIMAGRVVFAENSGGMLGQVVIVDHNNGMHTIYAKLSRLSPSIKVGKRLSKGSVIGKVDKSLMFEVTKNNKHINPMRLIQL